MCGLWHIFRGAGWCVTIVFLVLMVKPKMSQALEKWFTHCCISASVLLLREQSSANRSSLSVATFTCVFALSRLRLNTPQSVLHFSWMPSSLSCEASWSMAANTKLNRVGARTQPCFTPFVTGNESEVSPLSRTMALIPSCNWRTSTVCFLGQPDFSIISHSPFLQTVSNALVKSMNVMKRSSYCSWHFSCSWRAAKIMSTVPRPPRKPHWLSGSRPCSKWTIRRLSITRANIFPAMARREIPLYCHKAGDFPFCRGGWWTHLWAAEVLLPHPTYGRKGLSTSVAACHHHVCTLQQG